MAAAQGYLQGGEQNRLRAQRSARGMHKRRLSCPGCSGWALASNGLAQNTGALSSSASQHKTGHAEPVARVWPGAAWPAQALYCAGSNAVDRR